MPVYNEEQQTTLLEIVSMGINDDNAFDIMTNYSQQGIKNFVKCLYVYLSTIIFSFGLGLHPPQNCFPSIMVMYLVEIT